jgi:release factor glutamine methyltransferase
MRFLAKDTVGRGGYPNATLAEALDFAIAELRESGIAYPKCDAELLLLYVTGLNRTSLFTSQEQQLTAEQAELYHEPIQYITGEREFYGLSFRVTPAVLIPRPETEHLVEAAIERIPLNTPSRIVDVGTGSGAIAISLAVARPSLQVVAVDISPTAIEVAKENAHSHQVASRIRFIESDLLESLGEESFDLIVSNPPYIADSERTELDAEVRDYEPATALFAGQTGVEIYERLIPQAAQKLKPDGWLLLEIGAGQQSQLQQLLEDWSNVGFVKDLQGIPRVARAQRP